MRQLALIALLLSAAAPSCDPLAPGPVEVRVENASDRLMADVVVGFAAGEVDYGDVEPGTATAYREVDRAYRYAAVEAVVDGDTMRLQPIDYVGERLLGGGRYTYRLDLFEGRTLTLELVRD